MSLELSTQESERAHRARADLHLYGIPYYAYAPSQQTRWFMCMLDGPRVRCRRESTLGLDATEVYRLVFCTGAFEGATKIKSTPIPMSLEHCCAGHNSASVSQ